MSFLKSIFLTIVLFSSGANAESVTRSLLDETFTNVALQEGVPEKLLRAICWVESKHRPDAYNHGDGKGTDHAFGVCQVLHSTARDFGFVDHNCYRDFRYSKTRNYYDCKLFGVYTSILYGAKYLKTKLDQYGGDWEKAAAAYNAGRVIICKTGKVRRKKDGSVIGKCRVGHILNEEYVQKVMRAVEETR